MMDAADRAGVIVERVALLSAVAQGMICMAKPLP